MGVPGKALATEVAPTQAVLARLSGPLRVVGSPECRRSALGREGIPDNDRRARVRSYAVANRRTRLINHHSEGWLTTNPSHHSKRPAQLMVPASFNRLIRSARLC